MTKKQYIIAFLDKVKDIREPARGFVVLMRYDVLNEQQIEELFKVFKSVVESTTDQQRKYTLQRAIAKIEKLKQEEKKIEI
ncbi:MAG: hypothetical protein Q4B28_02985 [bacterium]|nr:hypothetical protein [bacterium]